MPPPKVRPKNLAGYLDSMTMRVFEAGMSWKVVEDKWSGIEEAFHGFDPEWVAGMSPSDVDHLDSDPRVIRNRRKIEATVSNARTMLDLDSTHHGFRRYLESFSDYEAFSKDLQRRFHFLGEPESGTFSGRSTRPYRRTRSGRQLICRQRSGRGGSRAHSNGSCASLLSLLPLSAAADTAVIAGDSTAASPGRELVERGVAVAAAVVVVFPALLSVFRRTGRGKPES